MNQKRNNFLNEMLFCLDYCWQEYCLALRQSVLLKCMTAISCTLLVHLQQWSWLFPVLLLLMLSVMDLRHYMIPDVLLYGLVLSRVLADLLACGLLQHSAGAIVWLWIQRIGSGLAVGVPLLLFVMLMDRLLQKESMGGGDIKLLFAIGFCLDAMSTYLVLYIACLIGIIWQLIMQWRKGDYLLPFGPSIAIATGIVMFCSNTLPDIFFSIL